MIKRIFVPLFLLCTCFSANSQNKKVLLEWYACSNEMFTADGYVFADDIRGSYDVIDVSVHAGFCEDSMSSADAKTLAAKFKSGSFPSGMLDRTDADSRGVIISREYWEDYAKKQEKLSPKVSIDIVNTFDPSNRELDVEVAVEYLQSISDSTYVTVYVVEDSVVGVGNGYDQQNGYNTTQGHPLYKAGNPIKGFVHRNVLRQNITGLKGDFLGRNKSKGDKGTYSKTITVPKSYDINQISIVAFVGYFSSSISGNEILNAEKASIPDCLPNFNYGITGKKVTFSNQSKGTFDNVKWDFGDGNSSTTSNPVHTYSKSGTYTVKLSLYDGADLCHEIEQDVTIPYECTADFSSTTNNLQVTFTNNSTGDIDKVSWNFGDGNSSSNSDPVYTYAKAGLYDVTLTLYDPDGNTCSTLKKTVTVADYSCSASFSESINNLTVSFTNTSSGDVDNVKWDFGDGNSSTTNSPNHTYSSAGSYTVKLTLYAPDNAVCDEIQKSVSVTSSGSCKASFTSTSDRLKASFTNTSTGNFSSVEWDFGDGNTSKSNDPNYTYGAAGNYTVTLTLYDANNSVCDDIQQSITVNAKSTCSASFSVIKNGLKVSLTNTSTGEFKSVSWDYGDGNTSSQTSPVYTYSSAGSYTITLTLMDANSNSCDNTTKEITLKNYTCQANFDFNVTAQTATFTNKSIGDFETVTWDFGDGDLSTKKDPEHTYSSPGVYNVCLTTFDVDKDSCGLTFCDEVTIEEPDNVGELMSLTDINIYPNPSTGLFLIELEEQHALTYLTVHDNMGKEVSNMSIRGNMLTLDLTNLPNGVFHVRFHGQEQMASTTVVKM